MPRRKHPLRHGLAALALLAGGAFIALAIVYWALPADSLPSWLPGHKTQSHPHHGHHHKRHGLAAFLLGLAFLASARLVLGASAMRPERS
jgi:hypothetical protein